MLCVEPQGAQNVLELLRKKEILLESPCNGQGLCGKCKIRIVSGEVHPLTPQEERFLTAEERAQGVRLACLTVPRGSITLDPLGLLGEGQSDVLGGGDMPPFLFDPPVSGREIRLEAPTLEQKRALCDGLNQEGPLPLSLLRKLPELMGKKPLEVVCREGQPVDLRTDGCLYGLAVDIGTTTVAVNLIDLHTGQCIGEDGFINPQKAYGLDVLSRIHYDMEHPGGVEELQKAIVQRLSQSARQLTTQAGVPLDAVYEMTVGGNSTMLHSLLRVPLGSLGRAPYSSVFNRPIEVSARELGFPFSDAAQIYCTPSVSAYIGGDIVAGALAARLDTAEDTVLFLDIGTNGEMILSRRGRMYACSCAAGPALEGMNISCGMRAEGGAVEHVSFAGGTAHLDVIGDQPPRGLCGSGILETVSQGVAEGVISPSGRLSKESSLTDTDEKGKRRIVLDRERGLFVTQGDVRQVQLCKGAILSGILTLLRRLELKEEEVDRVVVGGQFGKHLDPASLTGAGLVPRCLEKKITYIGNSSMTGAKMCLLSQEERLRAREIARKISYVELSVSPGYERLFTQCLRFESEQQAGI